MLRGCSHHAMRLNPVQIYPLEERAGRTYLEQYFRELELMKV